MYYYIYVSDNKGIELTAARLSTEHTIEARETILSLV